MSTRVALPPELDRGVYGTSEAASIAGLERRRVTRWLEGYTFSGRDGSTRRSGPIIPREREGVGFADLVEVLFVKGFLDVGVPMRVVRCVHEEASKECNSPYPFTLKRFLHDGRTIIERVRISGEVRLVDRYKAQFLMNAVMTPLVQKLRYNLVNKHADRYFPLGVDRPIVLDPQRSFGEPTVVRRGVPTRVIWGANAAGDSPKAIARWYKLESAEVDAALEYEQALRNRDAA